MPLLQSARLFLLPEDCVFAQAPAALLPVLPVFKQASLPLSCALPNSVRGDKASHRFERCCRHGKQQCESANTSADTGKPYRRSACADDVFGTAACTDLHAQTSHSRLCKLPVAR